MTSRGVLLECTVEELDAIAPWLSDQTAQVTRLLRSGLTNSAIAATIGVSKSRVQGIIDRVARQLRHQRNAEGLRIGPSIILSVRTKNCLLRSGFRTVEEIGQASDKELLRVRNLGATALQEIRAEWRRCGVPTPIHECLVKLSSDGTIGIWSDDPDLVDTFLKEQWTGQVEIKLS